jgi:hypothetical protein
MKAVFLALILTSALVVVHFGLVKETSAVTTTPNKFSIIALFSGWNSTLPPGSGSTCSPTGQPDCNPTITQFRGVVFTATVRYGGSPEPAHDFGVYTADITPINVSFTDVCRTSAHSGCLAVSRQVSSTALTAFLNFNASLPAEGSFTGPATYQFYCQFHPGTMHGLFQVFKSPDVNRDHAVNIIDLATVAFSFGATPTSANWNSAADVNNDGQVNILDLAFVAFYFGDTL